MWLVLGVKVKLMEMNEPQRLFFCFFFPDFSKESISRGKMRYTLVN